MTSLIYKQHNYKKSAHHKNNLLAHRGAELIKLRALVRETTQKPRFETNYVDNKLNGRAADFPTEKAIKPRLPDSD